MDHSAAGISGHIILGRMPKMAGLPAAQYFYILYFNTPKHPWQGVFIIFPCSNLHKIYKYVLVG